MKQLLRGFSSLSSNTTKTQLLLLPPSSSSSSSSSSSFRGKIEVLYYQIRAVENPSQAVPSLLDKWISQGNTLRRPEIRSLIRILIRCQQFHHALQISRWMTDCHCLTLSPRDAAVRLQLIHRVCGLEKAESYFEELPDNLRTYYAYANLLSGYVQKKYVQKAEAIMQKMRDKGMATSASPYNMLLKLYSHTGDLGKIEVLIKEMESNGIPLDECKKMNLGSAYASLILEKPQSELLCTPSTSSSSNYGELFDRIRVINRSAKSVTPLLDKWISEGNTLDKHHLQYLICLFKDCKQFHHALQISYWMTNHHSFTLSPSDAAIRVELIHKVCGLGKAECYFKKLPESLKTYHAYADLLSGYVRKKSVQKAEALMGKMRHKGMITSSFPYNMLIKLYSQIGDFGKIEPLIQEMERNGISQDKCTMINLIVAYAAASNVSGMERTVSCIKNDSQLSLDWKLCSMAASGCLKVRLIEVALAMLKKMESVIPPQGMNSAFNVLLQLYAQTGNKDELYRVWNMHMESIKPFDKSYSLMIVSLSDLNDIEGAERIFEEWESRCTEYNFNVLNGVLYAYCSRGLFEKADIALKKAMDGRTLPVSSWNVLLAGYIRHHRMHKAVDVLKGAILVARRFSSLDRWSLNACLNYLEGRGNAAEMEEIMRLLKNLKPLSRDMYHRWLRTCITAEMPVSAALDRMKMDGLVIDEETDKILKTRPVFVENTMKSQGNVAVDEETHKILETRPNWGPTLINPRGNSLSNVSKF